MEFKLRSLSISSTDATDPNAIPDFGPFKFNRYILTFKGFDSYDNKDVSFNLNISSTKTEATDIINELYDFLAISFQIVVNDSPFGFAKNQDINKIPLSDLFLFTKEVIPDIDDYPYDSLADVLNSARMAHYSNLRFISSIGGENLNGRYDLIKMGKLEEDFSQMKSFLLNNLTDHL